VGALLLAVSGAGRAGRHVKNGSAATRSMSVTISCRSRTSARSRSRRAPVSGKALGLVTPRRGVNMQTSKGVLQILTGALSGTAENSFLTTWKHS
jgi:hypothetical protein